MTRRIRALVVEDSLTVRGHLTEVLSADPAIEVVGEAADGRRAIELCQELRPGIVTLDMMLPVMSGLAATEYIMAYAPTPILIVSASTNRGELFKTYEALAAGALDVLDKPLPGEPTEEWDRRLIARVKLLAGIKVITHPRARLARRLLPGPGPTRSGLTRPRVLGLGASTGGPAALVELLRRLPWPFPLPVLLVLHIGEPFATTFADWLDAQTPHRVRLAVHGERLPARPGVLMAPPGRHLLLRGGELLTTDDPERHSCRPSVDVLFESLAREQGPAVAAALLTGMGRDGAAGLLAIRRVGGFTVAQDEATSVVYGMPREAVNLDAAERVLPISEIGPAMAEAAGLPS